MSNFLMPSLGADMEAGTMVEQLVAAGDTVRRGDVIAAVETQKGVIEIEVFENGILAEWLVHPGDTVPVGTPLAVIHDAGGQETPDLPEPSEPEPAPREAPQPVDPGTEPATPEDQPPADPAPAPVQPEIPQTPGVEIPPPDTQRRRITPAARRLAVRSGLDINSIPCQEEKVITRADVIAAATGPPPSRDKTANQMRDAIAAAMSRAKREIPHYYLTHEVDLTATDAFLKDQNADRPPELRLLPGAVYARAIAAALGKYPEFNGHYSQNRLHPRKDVHIGFAIHLRSGGLVAPALFDVSNLCLDEVMEALRDLVARVRVGRYRARELSEATITLSSLGDRGVDQLSPIIYPPQVAIIGIGTPRLRPALYDGRIAPRLMTSVTLAADHRASDGHRGARLLRRIEKLLQEPEKL
ncbi:dihydrolipoamide acetyltransferase family protein [Roseobacter sp.]|uniref:dihydrolipoamide acetyltransferase family protein n=1 Tax=Roseobacter sp. TaxID=1907202 RepID=UPI0025D148BA|nr:dihydrolipoamide acetyltransferase family protein [Roseobacter sp.]